MSIDINFYHDGAILWGATVGSWGVRLYSWCKVAVTPNGDYANHLLEKEELDDIIERLQTLRKYMDDESVDIKKLED